MSNFYVYSVLYGAVKIKSLQVELMEQRKMVC